MVHHSLAKGRGLLERRSALEGEFEKGASQGARGLLKDFRKGFQGLQKDFKAGLRRLNLDSKLQAPSQAPPLKPFRLNCTRDWVQSRNMVNKNNAKKTCADQVRRPKSSRAAGLCAEAALAFSRCLFFGFETQH